MERYSLYVITQRKRPQGSENRVSPKACSMGEMRFGESGDYWKLTKDGKLLNDKRASLTIENPDGTTREISYKELGLKSDSDVGGALAKLLGTNDTAIVNDVMEKQMHITGSYNADINNGKGVNLDDLSRTLKISMNKELFRAAYRDEIAEVIKNPAAISKYVSGNAMWSYSKSSTYDALSEHFMSAFGGQYSQLSVDDRKALLAGASGNFPMSESLANALQDPATYKAYAESSSGQPYCNVFLYEQLIKTDARAAYELFPDGLVTSNAMQSYLDRSAFTTKTSIDDIGAKVNSSKIILASLATGAENHIGFAIPNTWSFFNPLGVKGLPQGNGQKYTYNGITYTGNNFSVAGAGSNKAIGITSLGFAFGKDYKNSVQYYSLGWKK
mgnify:CR=1 FL=1